MSETGEKRERDSWDVYFMKIAKQASTRATCDRLHVGAIIVVDNVQVTAGYNGSPRKTAHCDDVGHLLKEMGEEGNRRKSCVRTVHGEANAIAQAARTGAKVGGGTLYTTASPCYDCMKLIINAGIVKVVCGAPYGSRYGLSDDALDLAKEAGLEVIFLSNEALKTNEATS
jgi:dCMP deaminase